MDKEDFLIMLQNEIIVLEGLITQFEYQKVQLDKASIQFKYRLVDIKRSIEKIREAEDG